MKFYINRAQLPFMVELPSKRFDEEAWRRLPELKRANGNILTSAPPTPSKGPHGGGPDDHER